MPAQVGIEVVECSGSCAYAGTTGVLEALKLSLQRPG